MSTLKAYKQRIQDALAPSFLEVADFSATHAGHKGRENAGAVSHVHIRIAAPCLEKLSAVEQHQKLYALFDEELRTGEIHAIQLTVEKP